MTNDSILRLRDVVDCDHPLFIIGSPRSGTTALASALDQHSRLWTPGETGFLFHLFGENRLDNAYMRPQKRPNGGWFLVHGIDRSEFLQYIGLGANALLSSRSGGRRWIEQTPLCTLMLGVLADMFPGAHFIHILRDGRQVVNSMMNFLNVFEPARRDEMSKFIGPWCNDFRAACTTWRDYVQAAMDFTLENPERCFTVLNADLSTRPEACFRDLFAFINLPFEDAPVKFIMSNRVNSSFAPKQRQAASAKSQTNWDDKQIRIFAEVAQPIIEKYSLPMD